MSGQDPMGFEVDPFEQAFGQIASPLHWPSLSEAETGQASADLRVWVVQLVNRFAIETRVIPPCWEQHNGIVEVLSALRDHERASYSETASPTAAVDWLRALRDVEARLIELASKTQCSVQEHRNDLGQSWATKTVTAEPYCAPSNGPA